MADKGASGQTLRHKLNQRSEKAVNEYLSSSKAVQRSNAMLLSGFEESKTETNSSPSIAPLINEGSENSIAPLLNEPAQNSIAPLLHEAPEKCSNEDKKEVKKKCSGSDPNNIQEEMKGLFNVSGFTFGQN